MNKFIRAFIEQVDIPNDDEFLEIINKNPFLQELKLMTEENKLTVEDGIKLCIKILINENTKLSSQMLISEMDKQKNGKQLGYFTGFKYF